MTREQIHIGDMSHEKAIGILKLMLEAMESYDGISPTPKRVNAMKMAIKSLEQEPLLDKIRTEIEQLRPNLRPEQMTDYDYAMVDVVNDIVAIFDKYKAESEIKE